MAWPILSKAIGFLTGDFAKEAMGFVRDRWPPNMSEQQKKEMELLFRQSLSNTQLQAQKLGMEIDAEFNQRIKDLEGTATDLRTLPIIGSLIIFLRGVQRPLWGFATIYLDYMAFTGKFSVDFKSELGVVLIIINFLVLGFLFGERTLKNLVPVLAPIIELIYGKRDNK